MPTSSCVSAHPLQVTVVSSLLLGAIACAPSVDALSEQSGSKQNIDRWTLSLEPGQTQVIHQQRDGWTELYVPVQQDVVGVEIAVEAPRMPSAEVLGGFGLTVDGVQVPTFSDDALSFGSYDPDPNFFGDEFHLSDSLINDGESIYLGAEPAENDSGLLAGKMLQPGAHVLRITNPTTERKTVQVGVRDVLGPVRLCSWNLVKLGQSPWSDDRYRMVTEIVDAMCDIVAVVEVMRVSESAPGYEPFLAGLNAAAYEANQGWQGLITEEQRPLIEQSSAEHYAVFYRSSRARVCDGWAGGLQYFKDGFGTVDPDEVPAEDDDNQFSREPAYACFSLLDSRGEPANDFFLAPYHAIFGDGTATRIGAEVSQLISVFREMNAQAQAEERDFVILGDFNYENIDDLIQEWNTQLVAEDENTSFVSLRSDPQPSSLSSKGERVSSYDHLITFDFDASQEFTTAQVLTDDFAVRSSGVISQYAALGADLGSTCRSALSKLRNDPDKLDLPIDAAGNDSGSMNYWYYLHKACISDHLPLRGYIRVIEDDDNQLPGDAPTPSSF